MPLMPDLKQLHTGQCFLRDRPKSSDLWCCDGLRWDHEIVKWTHPSKQTSHKIIYNNSPMEVHMSKSTSKTFFLCDYQINSLLCAWVSKPLDDKAVCMASLVNFNDTPRFGVETTWECGVELKCSQRMYLSRPVVGSQHEQQFVGKCGDAHDSWRKSWCFHWSLFSHLPESCFLSLSLKQNSWIRAMVVWN